MFSLRTILLLQHTILPIRQGWHRGLLNYPRTAVPVALIHELAAFDEM